MVISTIINQLILMFIYILIGAMLLKTKKLTLEGSKAIGNLLVHLVIPVVVIKAYITEYSPEKTQALILSIVFSALALGLAMLVSHLIFKKDPIEDFGAAFSNAGFMGIPLVSVLYGDEAVFYVSGFVALLNFLQLTYGVYLITKDKSIISLKAVLNNRVLQAFILGIIFYFTRISMPSVVMKALNGIAGLNAPLAMFSLGTYLAMVNIKEIFTDVISYKASVVRLVVIPLLTLLLLKVLPGNEIMKTSIFVVAITPIGSNVAIFAQLHNKDYQRACKIVCLSTLLCVLTIPVLMMFI